MKHRLCRWIMWKSTNLSLSCNVHESSKKKLLMNKCSNVIFVFRDWCCTVHIIAYLDILNFMGLGPFADDSGNISFVNDLKEGQKRFKKGEDSYNNGHLDSVLCICDGRCFHGDAARISTNFYERSLHEISREVRIFFYDKLKDQFLQWIPTDLTQLINSSK